ncbi:MAG: adenylyl-sulfate kinase [Acidobacteriota bacterium]
MTIQKSTNIVWHSGEVDRKARETLLGQKGTVLWFTGLSGSGKTTIAREVEKALFERSHLAYVLDGDNIRFGLNKNLGFSPEDRAENIRRIGEVAKLFSDAGVISLTAFISPYQADRKLVRELLKEGEFIEIYVKCPLEECENRDVKGLYQKARAGEIKEFTGISAPYEEPEAPEITLETASETIEESVDKVLYYLAKHGLLN